MTTTAEVEQESATPMDDSAPAKETTQKGATGPDEVWGGRCGAGAGESGVNHQGG